MPSLPSRTLEKRLASATNPDAIDRLVAEDFVLASGGVDFISRATGAQLAEIRDGGRRILACGHLQPGLPIMPNCPGCGLQERAIRRMPDNLPQVRGSSGKCRMEALMIRGVVTRRDQSRNDFIDSLCGRPRNRYDAVSPG